MGNYQSADLAKLDPKTKDAGDDPNALSAVREEIKKLAGDPTKQAIYKLLQKELSGSRGSSIGKAAGDGAATSGPSSADCKTGGSATGDPRTERAAGGVMVKESFSPEKGGTASVLPAVHCDQADAKDVKANVSRDMGPPPAQRPGYSAQLSTESVDSGVDTAAQKDYRGAAMIAPKKKFLGAFRGRSGTPDPADIRRRSGSFSVTNTSAGGGGDGPPFAEQNTEEKRARSYSFGGAEHALGKRPAPERSCAGVWYRGSKEAQQTDRPAVADKKERDPSQINIRTCIDAIIESSVVRDRLTPTPVEPERRPGSPKPLPVNTFTAADAERHKEEVLRAARSEEGHSPLRPQEIQHQVHSVLQHSLEREAYRKPAPPAPLALLEARGVREKAPPPPPAAVSVAERLAREQQKYNAAAVARQGGGVGHPQQEGRHGEQHNPISQLTAQVESVMKRHLEPGRGDGERHHELVTAAMRKQREPMLRPPPPGPAAAGQRSPAKVDMRGVPFSEAVTPHSVVTQIARTMAGRLPPPHQHPQMAGPRKVTAPVLPIQTAPQGNNPPAGMQPFPGPMPTFIPVQTPEGVRLVPAPFTTPHQMPPPELLAEIQAQAQAQAQEKLVRAQIERLREQEQERSAPPEHRGERHPADRHPAGFDPRHPPRRPEYGHERPGYPPERMDHRRELSPHAPKPYSNHPLKPYEVHPAEHLHPRRDLREVSPHPPQWGREPSLSPRERQVQEALRQEQQRLAEFRMGHPGGHPGGRPVLMSLPPPKPRSPPDIRMQDQMILTPQGSSPHHEAGGHSARSSCSNSPHRPPYPNHSPQSRSPYEQPPATSREYKSPHAANVKDSPLDLTVKKDCSPSSHGSPNLAGMYSLSRERSPTIPGGPSGEKQAVAHLLHDTVRKSFEESAQKAPYLMPTVVAPHQQPNASRPPMFMQPPHQPGAANIAAPAQAMGAPPFGGVAQIAPQTVQARAPGARPMPPHHLLPPGMAPPTLGEDDIRQPQHPQQQRQQPSPKVVDGGALARSNNPVSTRASGTNILGNHSPSDILYLRCKLCSSTYGSLHSFRKHFSKAHGCEPVQDHVSIQTISATKNALAKVGDESKEEKQNVLQSLNLLPSNVYYENQLAKYKTDRLSEGDAAPHRQVAEVHPVKPHLDTGKDVATVKPYSDPRATPLRGEDGEGGVPQPSGVGKEGGGHLPVKKEQSTMKCLQCGQDFPTRDWGVFKRHVRAHETAKEMPYNCSACKTGFRELVEWRTHMSVTHMIKACVCRACGAEFTHPSSLAKHVEVLHKGEAEVEYKCLYCTKMFSREADIIEHTQEHERHRAEYYKIRGGGNSDKSSSSSSSPINSPSDQSPLSGDKLGGEKDGSPAPEPSGAADGFRNRSTSFISSKIADEAQREQEMRPRATSFASPFRHAFRNYLEKMVEEEHRKQCIDMKPAQEVHACGQQAATGAPPPPLDRLPGRHPPTIQETREMALKRKAEMERDTLQAKMAKLDARMGPPPRSQPGEGAPPPGDPHGTPRSFMDDMVARSMRNYGPGAAVGDGLGERVPDQPPQHPQHPQHVIPNPEMYKLKRRSPSDEINHESERIADTLTKGAFHNNRTLSAAELAHRIIENRVMHFSLADGPTPPKRSSPPILGGAVKEEGAGLAGAPPQPNAPGAGSLKNFIEDLVAAEVNSYDSSEVSSKPSILAQLGEEAPKRLAPLKPPQPVATPPPKTGTPPVLEQKPASPDIQPKERERTRTWSKFDKIRRHHSMKQSSGEKSGTAVKTSRPGSPTTDPATSSPSAPVHPAEEKKPEPVRHISAVDVVHATISQAFMSTSPHAKPLLGLLAGGTTPEPPKSIPSDSPTPDAGSVPTVTVTEAPPVDRKPAPAGSPSPSLTKSDSSSDEAGDGGTRVKAEKDDASSAVKTPSPQPPAPPKQTPAPPELDPPSPFSDCSEHDLQIVLPEDDEEEEEEDEVANDNFRASSNGDTTRSGESRKRRSPMTGSREGSPKPKTVKTGAY